MTVGTVILRALDGSVVGHFGLLWYRSGLVGRALTDYPASDDAASLLPASQDELLGDGDRVLEVEDAVREKVRDVHDVTGISAKACVTDESRIAQG